MLCETDKTSAPTLFQRFPWLPTLTSCFFFSIMAFSAKVLSGAPQAAGWLDHRFPIQEVVFFRSFIMLLVVLPTIGWGERLALAPLQPHWRGILLRGGYGTMALFLYFLALNNITLSATIITVNIAPLFAAIFSSLVLHEAVPRRLYWAFPVTFSGVCLAAGHHAASSSEGFQAIGYLFAVMSALFSGAAYSMVRQLKEIPASVVVLSFTLIAVLASLPLLPYGYVHPTRRDLVWLLTMGITGGIAQMFMTLGYRYNTAARASSLNLATVGFTVMLAFLGLGERLEPLQWLGLLLIALGTVACSTSTPE